jgi:hypothetical protein
MKKNTLVRVGVAGLFAAMLLTSCYAPLVNQDASLSLSVKNVSPELADNQAILILIDSSYKSSLAEMLYLISKGRQNNGSLDSTDADRLTTLAKEIVTNGMVKFGGYPFYQLSLSGPSGVISIPGIPADRSYFAKLFVFVSGYSFDPKDIDANFTHLLSYESLVFNTESYPTDFATWTVLPGQGVPVKAGETASFSVSLTNVFP